MQPFNITVHMHTTVHTHAHNHASPKDCPATATGTITVNRKWITMSVATGSQTNITCDQREYGTPEFEVTLNVTTEDTTPGADNPDYDITPPTSPSKYACVP